MHEPTANRGSGDEFQLMVPLSEIYRFNEPEKSKSLVDAHKEGPPKSSDMPLVKRFIVSSGGVFFLMLGMIGLFNKDSGPLTILWLIAGIAILWFFLVMPENEKRKGKAEAQQEKSVSVSFNENDIVVSSRHYELKRQWPELIEYKKTKKGIHVYYIDGTANWLPADCFDGADEMNGLVDLLQKKLSTNDKDR